jgi:hypothetical protein
VKRLAVVLVAAASAFVACSGSGSGPAEDAADRSPAPEPEEPAAADDDQALIMAMALEQLVTVDHTFGDGPPPFTEYLIQTHLAAGTAAGTGRPLTDGERAAIDGAIAPLGPVRWIDDPDDWRTDDLGPTVEGAVILGVDEPAIDGDTARVPVSLWCGGLCGTWFTYRLDRVDGTWRVSGIDGPVAVA